MANAPSGSPSYLKFFVDNFTQYNTINYLAGELFGGNALFGAMGNAYNNSAGFRGTVNAVDKLAHMPLNMIQDAIEDPTGQRRMMNFFNRVGQGYEKALAGGENKAGAATLGVMLAAADMVAVTSLNEAYVGKELITNRELSDDECVEKYILGGVQVAGTALTIYEGAGLASSFRTGVRVRPKSCFPAGTPVATSEGLRPIETIRAGDRVWAYDLVASQWRLCRVKEPVVAPCAA